MDPEGVRQLYYAECGAAPDYRFREAMRDLPFPARYKESFFFGVHLPLTLPLPKRLDTTLQQWVGMHLYDAIVLADIDPVVLDTDDLLNLLAYVEAGGGLLLIGGPHSFSNGQRNWGALREALPGDIELRTQKRSKLWNAGFPEEPLPDARPVELAQPHPVTRGLTGPLGLIRNVQPLRPAADATIIARAGDRPVILAKEFGRGRVIMVSAFPGDERPSMFGATAWDDLLRQALAWLMRRDADLAIESASMETSPLPPGGSWIGTITIDPHASRPIRARASVSRADPGWLSVGREPQFGEAEEHESAVSGDCVEFTFRPALPGLWRVRIDVQGKDWSNTRTVHQPVKSATNLRLWTHTGEYVAVPGGTLSLNIGADAPATVSLSIVDFDGNEVLHRDGVATGRLDIDLPNLELGEYEVIVRADDDEARLRFCVTDPLVTIPFGLAGSAGGGTEHLVRWWYDHFRTRGFNAFETGVPASEAGPAESFRAQAFSHYLTQRDGMTLWAGYHGASLLSTHAHYGEEGSNPTRPCVFSPEYDGKVREVLGDCFRRAAMLPRMAALEILDEPHLMRANVCHCEHCRKEFKRRHGYELPTWDEALAARDRRTADYFEWVVDYAGEAFRKGFETWNSFGPGPKLFHVLCGIGGGGISIAHAVAEDLPWIGHAHIVKFDCYNYMYPNWRASKQLMWNEFHYMMGTFRFLAMRHSMPIGFYIQVTDRDVPVRPWDPLRAPSETLYTAIGGGAKTFHLMAKYSFTNTQNCREEKFDVFAEDIRKVNKVAPLLERAEAPRRRIAMVFAFHDRLYRYPKHYLPEGYRGLGFYGQEALPYDTTWPYHRAPINVAEMLHRAFGEVDVIDQRALRDGALDDYGGFVLTGVDYMDGRDAQAVAEFVQRGGALIADHVPSHDLAGKDLPTLRPFFGAATEHFYRDVTLARSRSGKGQTLLFSQDLNELYSGSVEQDDRLLRYRLKDTVREFLFGAGLRPHCRSANPEVEANVLLTKDTIVLVVVNHRGDRQQSRVNIFSPAIDASCAYDLVTMQPYPFSRAADGLAVDVDLTDREGLILGFYAAVPSQIAIVPDRAQARRGETFAFDVRLTDAAGKPARGDHIVDVRVTDAGGAERRVFGGLRCAVNGVLRIAAPLAVNARTGPWTITAFDRFTTRQVRAAVNVT